MSADRAGYVAGLRALADLLEQHDELPIPTQGDLSPMTFCYLTDDGRDDLVRFARIFPGPLTKAVREGEYGNYFALEGVLDGLRIKATAYRDTVCKRVVTGTREVVEEVPDPDALAAVPKVTVTKTVEDVEWVCGPLLAPHEVAS